MRAIILTNRHANQIALVNKLAANIEVVAVVISRNIPRRKPNLDSRIKHLANRASGSLVGSEFRKIWHRMLDRYSETYPAIPVERQITVDNVNDDATLEAITQFSPDLVLVSGTNIVGPSVIDKARLSGKIMNLHTGISPYVKGGPNCTNWCLAKGWFHLIGNTVMWIDKGIDTGNIIATERTLLDGSESLFDLHWKVMEHAHQLYVDTAKRFAAGKPLNDVSQNEIAAGQLFLSSQWNGVAMRKAMKNFNQDYSGYFSNIGASPHHEVKLFPLEHD